MHRCCACQLPPERRRHPPLSGASLGVAGGEKYLVGTVFLKFARDAHGVYGSDQVHPFPTTAEHQTLTTAPERPCRGIACLHTGLLNTLTSFRVSSSLPQGAAKSANHELTSLKSLMGCGVDGLLFPLMVTVDYCGHRLCAQSKLPISGSSGAVPCHHCHSRSHSLIPRLLRTPSDRHHPRVRLVRSGRDGAHR